MTATCACGCRDNQEGTVMTKPCDKTPLRQLIEAVEAGIGPDELAVCMPDQITTDLVYAAFRGSLDAAAQLHDALLPGWEWERSWSGYMIVTKGTRVHHGTECKDPARAWLISVLKAYESIQNDQR